MASLGHGISDAVRNHIPVWVDHKVMEVLYQEYKKSGGGISKSAFDSNVSTSRGWVRKSRKNSSNGYERLYQCKPVPKATLIVHSPPEDNCANAYVFCIDTKPVAGGKTKLKSTHITNAVSTKDKTSLRQQDVQFVKFSEAELIKLRTQMEFSDGLDRLEQDRNA